MTQENDQIIVFSLAEQDYGLPVGEVAEIIRMVSVDHVPQVPDWLCGVINFRGSVLPVVDLRMRLGVSKAPVTSTTPIIVTRGEEGKRIGLLVDLVDDMVSLTGFRQEGDHHKDLLGVGQVDDELVLLLNLPRIAEQTREVVS